jgi:hypothetical protein
LTNIKGLGVCITYQIDKCPICQTDCESGLYDFNRKKEVICARCGKYKIFLRGLTSSDIYKYKNGFAILSYYIKNFHSQEELLDREKINFILENNQLPDYEKKYDNLLIWLSKKSDFSTKSISGKPNNLASIIGTVAGIEVLEILDDIWGERLIEVEYPTGGSLRKHSPLLGFKVHLTPNGVRKAKVLSGENKPDVIASSKAEFDAFISHAGEDKNEIVRPLAEELTTIGFKIWYDEFQLKVGDSLRRSIDKGLSNSRFGIVVLSPSFFAKNWPQYELDGLVARESNGVKVILPLWHKVTKQEVMKYSPSLADKVALDTSLYSLAKIVEELSKVLK